MTFVSRWRAGLAPVLWLGLLATLGSAAPAQPETAPLRIVADIRKNEKSPFHLDLDHYPADRRSLPVGVFDSGTGGLTVLDVMLALDQFRNGTLENEPDRRADLTSERFVYLGDAANMPYGKYDAEGKRGLLREHIIKDAWFLLQEKYFASVRDSEPTGRKKPVKAIVIACNTATAYGLDDLRRALASWRLDIEVIGVVDAGALDAVAHLPGDGKGCLVGVLATEGTCASGGYVKAIREHFRERFGHEDAVIVQQPGIGLAGAIDGVRSYVDPEARAPRGSAAYHGPRRDHPICPVDPARWAEYRFDATANRLLVGRDREGAIREVELNAIINYIRYHVTSLVRRALDAGQGRRMQAVVLGCTHYPMFAREIREHLDYLRGLNARYGELIPEDVALIDPAQATARALYRHLAARDLLGPLESPEAEFYVSVPNPRLPGNRIDASGGFPFDYKYGRRVNRDVRFVLRVPFSDRSISAATLARIRRRMPGIHALITGFRSRMKSPPSR